MRKFLLKEESVFQTLECIAAYISFLLQDIRKLKERKFWPLNSSFGMMLKLLTLLRTIVLFYVMNSFKAFVLKHESRYRL